ncbi:MAG TPA: VOC family protein [Alphaproteobacteria bacterium]|nr:VOC family protein [Alphaproteobacteria bacterium]
MADKAGVPNIFPALKFKDAPKAIDWLGRAFGFQRQFVAPGEDGGVAHAQLRHGAGMIMMGSAGQPDAANPWTTEPFGIYVVVADIDAHFARAKAAGAKIERPLADTAYGSREYSARDCEGHLWSFGTYDPYAES